MFSFLLPHWHIRKLIIFVNSVCLVWSCCYISVVFGSIFLSTNASYFSVFRILMITFLLLLFCNLLAILLILVLLRKFMDFFFFNNC